MFEARTTLWLYYIINRNATSLEQLSIKSSTDIQFEGPVSVYIQNEELAFLFTSKSLIPLLENPAVRFDLIDGLHPNTIIVNGLPIPKPQPFSFVDIDGEKIASLPVYVYI